MSKKNDHKSRVLTQICIAYMLISTYSWYVNFDVNVFMASKGMSPFHNTRLILLTHVVNNEHVHYYPVTPRHFEVYLKNKEMPVSVSFEIVVDMSWQNSK